MDTPIAPPMDPTVHPDIAVWFERAGAAAVSHRVLQVLAAPLDDLQGFEGEPGGGTGQQTKERSNQGGHRGSGRVRGGAGVGWPVRTGHQIRRSTRELM